MNIIRPTCLLTSVAVAALVLSAGTINAEGLVNESENATIVKGCQEEWPADYRMQAYCIKRQREAAESLFQDLPGNGTEDEKMLARCMYDWKKPDLGKYAYNWRMVEYCYRRQREARDFVLQQGGR